MLSLTNEQKGTLRISPKTAGGRPASVDGAPVWALADGPVTIEVAADGLSAVFTTPDSAEGATIQALTVTADADLGDGVRAITLNEEIVFGPAPAETLGASFETEIKPAA